jgi:uncharacterized protein with GYD domain
MARFMLSGSYTSEGLAATMKAGLAARTKVVADATEALGGQLVGLYWTTGERDSVVIVDFPDATGAVALVTAVKAAGAAHIAVSRLYDGTEFDSVMATTAGIGYTPPVQLGR